MSDDKKKKKNRAFYQTLITSDLANIRYNSYQVSTTYRFTSSRLLKNLLTDHSWTSAMLGITEEWEGAEHRCPCLVLITPFLSIFFVIATIAIAICYAQNLMSLNMSIGTLITNIVGFIQARNVPGAINTLVQLKIAIKYGTAYTELLSDADVLRFKLREEYSRKSYDSAKTIANEITQLMKKKEQIDISSGKEGGINNDDEKSIMDEVKNYIENDKKQDQEFFV